MTDVQVPFDSAQLRKHGTFFNTQLFVHSLSVLNDQYVLVADVYQSVQFIRWVPDRNELSFLGQDLDGPLECYGCNYLVSQGQVGMVVTDSAQNINVFQYAPTGAQSHQQHHIGLGRQVNYERRLLCTTRYVKSVLLYMLVVLVVYLPVPIII